MACLSSLVDQMDYLAFVQTKRLFKQTRNRFRDTNCGGHYKDEEMHLWTFNDAGKVIRLWHFLDTHKHMQAAKLV